MSRHEAPAPRRHPSVLHLIAALVSLAIAMAAASDDTYDTPSKVFTVTLFSGLAAIVLYAASSHTN